jgi:nucleotide-binding universal stress UspA family protein
MEPLDRSVLVGVTGKGENTDALRFAVREARVLRCGVTLAHVVETTLPPPPPSILMTGTGSEVGDGIVEEVGDELEELLDADLPVVAVVRHGRAGAVLAELSKTATRVVLQHRDLSRLHRVVTGSTVAGVATHAHCPVVSVPPAPARAASSGLVSVGVHEDGGPTPVLEAAFAESSGHSWSLRLVHAWRLPPGYDDLVAVDDRWAAHARASIRRGMEPLEAEHPDVQVDVHVRYDFPGDVLASASEDSDLLVVGRHGGHGLVPARLGSIARAMLSHASCPVMVVPL